jgi:hypothetical protein
MASAEIDVKYVMHIFRLHALTPAEIAQVEDRTE